MPQSLIRAMDLQVRRRMDGLLAGDVRASSLGTGSELSQVRRYEPGDDVRQIDWNVTARTGEPHVRVHIAEKTLTAWVILDLSASMTFGTEDRRKADVAEGAALAIGHLATRRGNRLGVMTFGDPAPQVIRPGQGRVGMLRLLMALRRDPPPEGGGATSLGLVLSRAAGIFRSRSAVFVISDFRGARDWKKPLQRLTHRHEVFAVEIRDRREQELPDVGDLWLIDPETGRQLRVDTANSRLRRRFSQAAAAERGEVASELRSTGADHVVLWTSGDWLRTLARTLSPRVAPR